MKPRTRKGPKIATDPDYAAVVSIFSKLHVNEIEYFFYRLVKDRATAIIARELAYWFSECSKTSGYPRAKIYRDQFYWVSRTKHEWLDAHGICRKEVERAYVQTKEFVLTKVYKFGGQPTTHWRFIYPPLLAALRNDTIIRKRLSFGAGVEDEATSREQENPTRIRENAACTNLPLDYHIPECTAAAGEASISECRDSTDDLHNHNQSPSQAYQTTPTTGCAGPANAGAGVPSPSAQSGAAAPEPPLPLQGEENPAPATNGGSQTIPEAQVVKILKQSEKQPQKEKLQAVMKYPVKVRNMLCYLLIWQAAFEKDHEGASPYFNAEHIRAARALAEQEIHPLHFASVLKLAWEERGASPAHDPLFMCRNHSRKFSLFCRHFVRMEEELVEEGRL